MSSANLPPDPAHWGLSPGGPRRSWGLSLLVHALALLLLFLAARQLAPALVRERPDFQLDLTLRAPAARAGDLPADSPPPRPVQQSPPRRESPRPAAVAAPGAPSTLTDTPPGSDAMTHDDQATAVDAGGENNSEDRAGDGTAPTAAVVPTDSPGQAVVFDLADPEIREPKLIPSSDREPTYPRQARLTRTAGRVDLELVIDPTGAVREATVLREQPIGMGFGAAARDAALQRRYLPATRAGVPVAVRLAVRLDFRLD